MRLINLPNPFWSGTSGPPPIYDYSAAYIVYSLRKIYSNWDLAFMAVRRSSDDALAYIFFDGAIPYYELNLNNYIGTINGSTPTTTTLATWAGMDTVRIALIYGQNSSGSFIPSTDISDASLLQNVIMSGGVLVTKNGRPAINMTGTTGFVQPTPLSQLNPDQEFTIVAVASLDTVGGHGALWATDRTGADTGATGYIDSRSNKEIAKISGTVTGITNYIAQQDTTNQKLLTTVKTLTDVSSYYNGVAQELNVPWSGTYVNDEWYVCRATNNIPQFFEGTFQELIVFPNDQTANLAAIHADINTHYSIYP